MTTPTLPRGEEATMGRHGGDQGGRPRVGTPAGERRGRRVSKQTVVRLGIDQPDQVAAVAAKLRTSGAEIIRRAARRIVAGDIALPTDPAQVPAPLPSSEIRTVVLGDGQEAALDDLAATVPASILLPEPERPTGPGRPPTPGKPRDALLRYALAVELAAELGQ